MPKFNSKKEWLDEAKRLKATGLSAKEVAAKVGEFSPQPGQRYSIHNSSKNGVVAVDMEARLKRGNKRANMERSQSLGIGDTEMPRNTTSKTKKAENGVGPGMELHHRISLIQNTPFYDGLSDEEARQFTSWARQQGWDLGNTDGNTNIPLKISEHKGVHAWMRENDIEGARGPQARLTKGFEGMSLDDRKYAFRNYMAYVQKGVDEHMSDTLGDVSVSSKHDTAQKNNLRIVQQQNEVERLKSNIGEVSSGPRAGQRLPVNRRTLGDAIISDLQTSPTSSLQIPKGLSAKRLAQLGLVLPSVWGVAASGAETTLRTDQASKSGNPLDWLQAGLSGTSLVADFVPGVGEFVSTPADAANTFIDSAREPKVDRQQQLIDQVAKANKIKNKPQPLPTNRGLRFEQNGKPTTGKAILNGKEITVPYGSVAGEGKNFAQKAWDSFNSLF